MMSTLEFEEALGAAARRAYEHGRWRSAGLRGLALSVLVALMGLAMLGPSGLWWAPAVFAVWSVVWWRGGAMLRGGQLGLLAGAGALLFPWSMVRSCCAGAMSGGAAACCTRPGACSLVGVGLGLALSAFLPRGRLAQRGEAALGMALGTLCLAGCRCATLCVGEAWGVVGALLASLVLGVALRPVLVPNRG